jgi:CDGSH-type Zn-finger protein/uncharacterized Fe-S cluster protein YjdI
MARETVEGTCINISFDGGRCIHARRCVLGRPEVFEANAAGEWIHPDAVSVERIVETAESCPSGAITYHRIDGGPEEIAPAVNTARVWENGPLAFHAELDVNGEVLFRAVLCRCGESKNKPYCDGSHRREEFVATGEPPTTDAAALANRNGRVTVSPQANGPLKVEGNLEIIAGSGRMVNRTTKVFLCRCGHSGNKPYCDGTHKRVGFLA